MSRTGHMIALFICQALNPRHFTAEGIETRRFLLICRAALVPSERRFTRIIPASLEGATGMAMHLDHFSISSPNLYYGAHRLRLESTLSFYDGGHFLNGDHANRIFPLGANTYLELGGIVSAESVVDPKNRPWWYEKVQTVGECFTGLCFRVDTQEELEAIAKKK